MARDLLAGARSLGRGDTAVLIPGATFEFSLYWGSWYIGVCIHLYFAFTHLPDLFHFACAMLDNCMRNSFYSPYKEKNIEIYHIYP